MKIIEWNINRSSVNRMRHQLRNLAERKPDVVVLVEVSKKARESLIELLGELNFENFVFSQHQLKPQKLSASGVLIASHWPVHLVQRFPDLKFPDRVLTASVDSPLGHVEITALYAPPGTSTKDAKVETIEAVYEYLAKPHDGPRLLTGDFSSPKSESEDGTITPFGANMGDNGRWANAELSILQGLSEFGMVDAYRALHGYAEQGWSHKVSGKGKPEDLQKRYDHLIASESLLASHAEYLHEFDAQSTHSPLEVVFE